MAITEAYGMTIMSEIPTSLAGKKILLIVASFFGYDKEIVKRLVMRGAEVVVYEDRPSTTTIGKIITRLSPRLVEKASSRYLDRIISECGQQAFDEIVVIKGEGFTPRLLQRLFDYFPHARKTFYLWDSFKNCRGAKDKLALFDRCLSFDPIDAASTDVLSYRPLFYVPSYIDKTSTVTDIDVLFVGTVHTDRYAVLKRIRSVLPKELHCFFFLYFPTPLLFYFRRCFDPSFWRARKSEFKFKPLSHKDNSELYSRARVIVDIERSIQAGLTMRTFEAVASGKKLITTNPHVASSEFFNKNNMCIVDRKCPDIPRDFLSSDFIPLSPEVLYKYSLDGWIDDVFC